MLLEAWRLRVFCGFFGFRVDKFGNKVWGLPGVNV